MRVLAWLISLALAAIPCAPSSAQGTRGELPDPITAARVGDYAQMLDMSPQQRHAWENLHADYRTQAQAMREGPIETWLQGQRSGFIGRDYARTQQELLKRIAAIDERFFDAAIPMLTEEQNSRLQRVRQLRQRERLMQVRQFWNWKDGRPFDISQAVFDLQLSVEQRGTMDSVLSAYEPALTSRLEAVVDEHFKFVESMNDAFSRAGFTEERLADPAESEAVMELYWSVAKARTKERRAAFDEVVSLDEHTLESLMPLLPDRVNRSLRAQFVTATYSTESIFSGLASLVRITSPYEAVLDREDLTEDQRSQLRALANAFDAKQDTAVSELVQRVKKHRAAYDVAPDREQEFKDRTAIEREMSEAWQSLMTVRKNAMDSIASIVGKSANTEQPELDPESADLSQTSVYSIAFERPEISGWLPAAINARDLAMYRRWLGLTEDEDVRLQTLHAQYVEQFAAFKDTEGEAVVIASRTMYAGDTVKGFTAENLRSQRAALAIATSRQQAIESAFFDELAAAFHRGADDLGMRRVRLARHRQWLNGMAVTGSQTRQPGGRSDGLFDLEMLLRRVRSFDASLPEIDGILAEYETAITPLLQARLEAVRAYSRVSDEGRVEWARRRVVTGKDFPDLTDWFTASKEHDLRVAATKAAEPIAELNAATVERLAAAMPPDAAERLRRTYERMAWPRIHEDRSNAGPLLERALGLEGLGSDQRAKIENIAAEYRPAYEAMCEAMKATVEGAESPIFADGQRPEEEWIEFQKRHRQRQRMLFDRHELNMRARQELKAALTEGQAAGLGLSGPPPEGPGEQDDFGT